MWSNWKGAGSEVTLLLILGSLNPINSLGIALNVRGYSGIIGSVQRVEAITESSLRVFRLESQQDKPSQVTDLRVESIGKTHNNTDWYTVENETPPFFIVELNWTAAGHQMDKAIAAKFVEIRASLREGEMLSDFNKGRLIEGVRTESVPAGQEQKARFKLPPDLINGTLQAEGKNSTDIYFALVTINPKNQKAAEMSNVARGSLAFSSEPPFKESNRLRGQFIIMVSGILALFGMCCGIVLFVSNLVFMCKKSKNVYEIDRECKIYVINV